MNNDDNSTQIIKIEKLCNYTNRLLFSKWLIIGLVALSSLISLFFYLNFIFWEGTINGEDIGQWKQNSKLLLYIILPVFYINSISGILADVFFHRSKRRMFIFSYIYYISSIFIFYLIKTFLLVIFNIVFLIPITIGYLNWNSVENESEYKIKYIKMSKFILLILLLIVVSIGTGFLLKGINVEQHAFLDSFIVYTFIFGLSLMSRKYINIYFIYFLSTTAMITLFIITDVWVLASQNFIFLGLQLIGFINWYYLYKKQPTTL